MINHLIKSRARVNCCSDFGDTLIFLASARRYPGCIEKLIQAGTDATLRGPTGYTALELAALSPLTYKKLGHWKQYSRPIQSDERKKLQTESVRFWLQRLLVLAPAEVSERVELMSCVTSCLVLLEEERLASVGILLITRCYPPHKLRWCFTCTRCMKEIELSSETLHLCKKCAIPFCKLCYDKYDEHYPSGE